MRKGLCLHIDFPCYRQIYGYDIQTWYKLAGSQLMKQIIDFEVGIIFLIMKLYYHSAEHRQKFYTFEVLLICKKYLYMISIFNISIPKIYFSF